MRCLLISHKVCTCVTYPEIFQRRYSLLRLFLLSVPRCGTSPQIIGTNLLITAADGNFVPMSASIRMVDIQAYTISSRDIQSRVKCKSFKRCLHSVCIAPGLVKTVYTALLSPSSNGI